MVSMYCGRAIPQILGNHPILHEMRQVGFVHRQSPLKRLFELAPSVGIEPTNTRLTVAAITTLVNLELYRTETGNTWVTCPFKPISEIGARDGIRTRIFQIESLVS